MEVVDILPRIKRPAYLVLSLVLLALALAFGGPLALGALWAWLLLGAVDAGWSLAAASQVAALYRVEVGNYTAGDPLDVQIELGNEGWLPIPALVLRDAPESSVAFTEGGHPEVYGVPSGARLELRRTLAARRGQYRLGPLDVSVEGPFGLFAWTRRVFSEREITVSPRLQPLSRWPLEQAEAFGRPRKGFSPYADPTLVATTRPMLPGDSMRRIHWKRTAHTGTLQVREPEPASGGHGTVLLDLWGGSYGRGRDGRALDAAAEITAAVAHAILRSGADLSLLATGKRPIRLTHLRGTRSMAEVLDALASVEPDGPRPLRDWLRDAATRIPWRSVVVVVTPAHPATWATGLVPLQTRGAGLAAVLVTPAGSRADGMPQAVADLRRMGCLGWPASSATQLAELLAGPHHRRSS